MGGKVKQLISNILIFGLGSVLVKVIQVILMPIYTSHLTPEAFGTGELLLNSVELLYPLISISIFEAVFRFLLDKEQDKKVIISVGLRVMFFSIIICLIIAGIFQYFFDFQFMGYMIVIVLLAQMNVLFSRWAMGIEKNKVFAMSGVIGTIVLLGSSWVTLNIYNMGIDGFFISNILYYTVSVIFLFFAAGIYKNISIKHFDMKTCKTMIKYSLPLIPNTVAWWILNLSTKYVVQIFLGFTIAGIYAAAYKIPSMITMVVNVFDEAWRISASKDVDNADSDVFFKKTYKSFSIMIFLATSVVIAIAPYISAIFLKGDFFVGYLYVPALLLATYINGHARFFVGTFVALKKTGVIMVTSLIGGGVSIVLSIFLIRIFGIFGVLFSLNIGYFATLIGRYFAMRDYIDMPIKYCLIPLMVLVVQTVLMSCDNSVFRIITTCISVVSAGVAVFLLKDMVVLAKKSKKQFII